jgi:hypothetical protein
LKEAAILFLLSVAACAAVRMAERMTLASVGVLAGAIALLLTFRGPIALVGGAGLVGGVALAKREVLGGLTAGLSALAVAAVLVLVVGIGYSGVRATLQASSLAESNKVRSGLAQGSNTGFGSEIDTSTPRRAISYLPVGLTRFTVGPFPWEVRGIHQLPALIDVVVLWALVPSAARGFRKSFATLGRRVAVLILPSSVMAVVLALSVGNIGILVRERMQAFILVVPFIALGLSLRAATPRSEPEPDRPPALRV